MHMIDTLTIDQFKQRFPKEWITTNALYYPASEFDGGVIQDCNERMPELGIQSFIYCDYGQTKEKLQQALSQFKGYKVFAHRELTKAEFDLDQCTPNPRLRITGVELAEPYVYWAILEREEGSDAIGPSRFSLLYVAGKGWLPTNTFSGIKALHGA
jgi:hypothetical protein